MTAAAHPAAGNGIKTAARLRDHTLLGGSDLDLDLHPVTAIAPTATTGHPLQPEIPARLTSHTGAMYRHARLPPRLPHPCRTISTSTVRYRRSHRLRRCRAASANFLLPHHRRKDGKANGHRHLLHQDSRAGFRRRRCRIWPVRRGGSPLLRCHSRVNTSSMAAEEAIIGEDAGAEEVTVGKGDGSAL